MSEQKKNFLQKAWHEWQLLTGMPKMKMYKKLKIYPKRGKEFYNGDLDPLKANEKERRHFNNVLGIDPKEWERHFEETHLSREKGKT